MPRFQISGQKRNSLPQFESRALAQGGETGYNESGRHYLSSVSKALSEALKDIPDDANLTLVGSIEQSGQTLDMVIEVHANHPRLGDAPDGSRYKEPSGVHNPDGSRGNHPNADTRDEKLVAESKRAAGEGSRTPSTDKTIPGAPASEGNASIVARGTEGGFEGATGSGGIGRFAGEGGTQGRRE